MSARALVVDDDPAWQEILRELLEDSGLEVEAAATLAEGLEGARRGPYRVAVVDLALAGGDHRNQDGLRVLDALQQADPGCRTVLLSGYATVEIAVQALTERGAVSCLRKESFSRAEFRRVVEASLRAAPTRATVAPAGRTAGPGALLVEDDGGWRSLLEEMLLEADYQVTSCASFADALGHVRSGAFAVAVVDLNLASTLARSNQDGLRLLERLREREIPALVVSGTADPALVEQVYEQAAHCFEKHQFDRVRFREALIALSPADPFGLTEREREVLDLLVEGLTNPAIGERLFISPNTVKQHLKAIFEKLGVKSRAGAVAVYRS